MPIYCLKEIYLNRVLLVNLQKMKRRVDCTWEKSLVWILLMPKMSQRIDAELVRGEINPEAILKQFKSENKRFTIAARFSGKVQSAFPAGRPKPVKDKNKNTDDKKLLQPEAHVNETQKILNMIVMADTDLLTSRFWLQQQE